MSGVPVKSLAAKIPTQWLQALTTPTRFELTVLYLLLGGHIVLGTDAAIHLGWYSVVCSSLFAVEILFVLRLGIAALILFLRVGRPKVIRWVELVSIVILLAVIYTTNLGLRARVLLSEQQLIDAVRYVRHVKPDGRVPLGAYGLFTIQGAYKNLGQTVKTGDSVVWLETVTGCRYFEPPYSLTGGIVYSEQGRPPDTSESYYEHLYGPWWLWLEDI